MSSSANFLFEMGMLAKQQRTGFAYLGTGQQSIAEHINRVCYVGYVLAQMDGTVDLAKVVMMCLFHDMAEARSLDHNYVAQRYVTINEVKIVEDQTNNLPYGQAIKDIVAAYEARDTQEALLAKDADNIELLLFLKEQLDLGNSNAQAWIDIVVQRVKTDVGKKLTDEVLATPYNQRWGYNMQDQWWVNRMNT